MAPMTDTQTAAREVETGPTDLERIVAEVFKVNDALWLNLAPLTRNLTSGRGEMLRQLSIASGALAVIWNICDRVKAERLLAEEVGTGRR
jgi:hypothetical protein